MRALEKAAATKLQAEQEAQRWLSEAHVQATTIRDKAQTEVNALRGVLASLEAERSAAQKARLELQQELQALEKHIAKVKADALAALGA